ncbi:MAG: ParB/RepB/Spo0J family partition protein [Chlamydiae bacterium]|nr:ParB/RepB/Spo0J family partition protein [Chlamydiota bacterium]
MAKQALGKGLGALIQKNENLKVDASKVEFIDIHLVDANPQQPRKDFEAVSLGELKDSIKTNGILQPILVRKQGSRYELIAGERRLRAARELALTTIPALIKETTDEKSLEIAIIENIQRQNLNPMEEARAFMKLMRDYKLTQDTVAEKVGKNRATVANTLRLLNLQEEIQEMIEKGLISLGHAKAILGVSNPSEQLKISKEIVARGLSVREVEEKVHFSRKLPLHKTRSLRRDPVVREIEEKLESSLHTRVCIKQGVKKGRIEVEYYSSDDLERLVDLLAPSSINLKM